MCIIVCKPKGVKMPNDEIISTCFENNPDGAGLMWADGSKVHIAKGYFSVDTLLKKLNSLGNLTDKALVMHFRIRTHGEIAAALCHPFPVSSNIKHLRTLHLTTTLAVAHNGVISGVKTDNKTSDTMAYIRDVIAPLRELAGDVSRNKNALNVIKNTVGSKLAFLNPSGDIVTVGEFIKGETGVLYSNSTYQPYTYNYTSKWAKAWDYESKQYELEYDACNNCDTADECKKFGAYCPNELDAIEYASCYPLTYTLDERLEMDDSLFEVMR